MILSIEFLIRHSLNNMSLGYTLYIYVGNLLLILIKQDMYLSSKMRAMNKALRKRKIIVNKRGNVNILVSSRLFDQELFGMGRIPNRFIPFSPMENVFWKYHNHIR